MSKGRECRASRFALVARPAQRRAHRALPAEPPRVALRWRWGGPEGRETLARPKSGRVGPHPGGDPGQTCRTQGGRLDVLGTFHWHAEDVRLKLHEPIVRRRPTVH